MIHSTISGNKASLEGGGICVYSFSDVETFINNILWQNETTAGPGPQIALLNFSTLAARYCDIEGGAAGVYLSNSSVDIDETNIDADPLFISPGHWDATDQWVQGDYHLSEGSPCIDAGTDAGIETDIFDLDRPHDVPGVGKNGTGDEFDMGAHECYENLAPELDPIGSKAGDEGQTLSFTVVATDPDGTIPSMSASNLPDDSGFIDNGNGTGTFTWHIDYSDAGVYPDAHFEASDGVLTDSEDITITINNVPRAPAIDPIGNRSVDEGQTLSFTVVASDPDGTIPSMSVSNLPDDSSFIDYGDGTGMFIWNTDYFDSGIYTNVHFEASDGVLNDSEDITITVIDTPRAPILHPIGDKSVDEGQMLSFTVTATDPDGTEPSLSVSDLPDDSSFVDNGDGTGIFTWHTDNSDAGTYVGMRFEANDGLLTDSEEITIFVDNTPGSPVLDPIGNRNVDEGQTLSFTVVANDPDGTIPSMSASNLPDDSSFADNGNGTGTFTWDVDYSDADVYPDVHFEASDGVLTDGEDITIMVNDVGPPCGTYYVPDDYPTIQAALDDLANCDTIIVRDDTYTGAGNTNLDFRGKAITLRSENGPENCIIDCEYASGGFVFWQGEPPDAVLDGFTIINGEASYGGGIYVANSSPTIRNCVIQSNSAAYGGGICFSNSSATLTNCTVTNNTADQGAGGIYFYDSDAAITHCTISDNSAISGGGIFCYLGSPAITNAILTGNEATYGPQILLSVASSLGVSYSNIEGGEDAAYVEPGCTLDWGEGNIDRVPRFVGSGDYHLIPVSPCIDTGTDVGVTTDIDGDSRPLFAGCDMGSDECVDSPRNLTQISLEAPTHQEYLYAAPVLKWMPNGGTNDAFIVDLAVPGLIPLWSGPVVYDTLWLMPVYVWDAIPYSSDVYWRVRGADLDQTPLTIVTSDEVWTFRKD